MTDLSVECLGGELAGQVRSPVTEDELAGLGYRLAVMTKANGAEEPICIAVPITWSADEAHRAIQAQFGANPGGRVGKRSR